MHLRLLRIPHLGTGGDRSFAGFGAGFLAISAGLNLLIERAPTSFFEAVNRLNAALTHHFMVLAGFEPHLNGFFLTLNGFRVQVIGECSAVFTSALLTAFVATYPGRVKSKLLGIGAGICVLVAVNILRMALLLYIGAFHRRYFEPLHIYVGQVVMVGVVIGIAVGYIRMTERNLESNFPAAFLLRFLCISAPLFLAWLYLSRHYATITDHASRWVLGFFISLGSQGPSHSHQPVAIITFNLVAFVGLVLATRGLETGRKLKWLSCGTAGLAFLHFLLSLLHTWFLVMRQKSVVWVIHYLLMLSEWILPFLLWALVSRRVLFNDSKPAAGRE